jgi:hypothetical protein
MVLIGYQGLDRSSLKKQPEVEILIHCPFNILSSLVFAFHVEKKNSQATYRTVCYEYISCDDFVVTKDVLKFKIRHFLILIFVSRGGACLLVILMPWSIYRGRKNLRSCTLA